MSHTINSKCLITTLTTAKVTSHHAFNLETGGRTDLQKNKLRRTDGRANMHIVSFLLHIVSYFAGTYVFMSFT